MPAPLLSFPFVAGLKVARGSRYLTPPEELNGRSFAITVIDFGMRHVFCCRDGRFSPHWSEQTNLEFCAKAVDFLSLLRRKTDADTLFFQRRLQISGDTELGLIVKNWLDATQRPTWLK